jgi:hypothetical protein
MLNLPTSKGEKQTTFKKENCLCVLYGRGIQHEFDLFYLSNPPPKKKKNPENKQTNKILKKYSIKYTIEIMTRIIKNSKTFAFTIQLNENSMKEVFIEIFFCLFCNFCGSKPLCTRTQNRKKPHRNSLKLGKESLHPLFYDNHGT